MTGPDAVRYRLDRLIAVGGMGEVWQATDTLLERAVAVKVLKAEYAGDATFRARFAAEARHAAALQHPNIAGVLDVGERPGDPERGEPARPYLVMELVEGQPLSALLAPREPLDPEQAAEILAQAAEGVQAAHQVGIVHRDVKPANLLVTPEGQVKVTDFGIARAADAVALTVDGHIVGTPHYLAPEQARGERATLRSDVYALGIVLFECLTGHRPFDHDSPVAIALMHVDRELPPLPEHVPGPLVDVVRRATAKDPQQRHPSAAALAHDLRTQVRVPATTVMPAAEAPTVAASPAPDAPAGAGSVVETLAAGAGQVEERAAVTVRRLSERVRRWPRVPLVVATGVVVLFLALLSVRLAEDPQPGRDEQVLVTAGDYVGRPVAEARADLEQASLTVAVERRANPGSGAEGTVAAVQPTGEVAAGTEVTLVAWGPGPADAGSGGASPVGTTGGPDGNATGRNKDKGGASGQGKGNGKGNGNGKAKGKSKG